MAAAVFPVLVFKLFLWSEGAKERGREGREREVSSEGLK